MTRRSMKILLLLVTAFCIAGLRSASAAVLMRVHGNLTSLTRNGVEVESRNRTYTLSRKALERRGLDFSKKVGKKVSLRVYPSEVLKSRVTSANVKPMSISALRARMKKK